MSTQRTTPTLPVNVSCSVCGSQSGKPCEYRARHREVLRTWYRPPYRFHYPRHALWLSWLRANAPDQIDAGVLISSTGN